MKKVLIISLLVFIISESANSFCGFYVSKADGTLKNKTSQVILVRDGERTVITMYNDFKGDVKDFAMVVPVPVVLQKSDIKIVDNAIFKTLNDYSAPRLVEYFDQNPCNKMYLDKEESGVAMSRNLAYANTSDSSSYKKGVTIEASYTVGEYDILILSAKESSGLKTWLTENGYKIPKGAEEVLEPYIKSNLKFFVVKVNLKEKEKAGLDNLRPIQIKFNSPKFMLPIRLGMANSDGDQDLIVYAFTKTGKVEATNYRTVPIPSSQNVPLFVQNKFTDFYSSLFQHQWSRENKSVVFTEYAWDVSPANYVKCDPCASNPPDNSDLNAAGVWWIGNTYTNYVDEYEPGKGQVYFTRLHIRYNRKSFPQDLFFQVTPDKENFQARYIITHPASGNFTCEAGKRYLKDLRVRREKEMDMLGWLTGKPSEDWNISFKDEENQEVSLESTYAVIADDLKKPIENEFPTKGLLFASTMILGCITFVRWRNRIS